MNQAPEYRLYSFVANGYLSPLQCGLQTAHTVSKMSQRYKANSAQGKVFGSWAQHDHTIIICGAFNHGGVVSCFEKLEYFGEKLNLPTAIFNEDAESMNGMATACSIVVPRWYYDVTPTKLDDINISGWEFIDDHFHVSTYPATKIVGRFISHIKQYRLA